MRILFLLLLLLKVEFLYSQISFVRANDQVCFPNSVPAGNYSGITHLHDNIYAVVSDKSDSTLWFRFKIDIDTITGKICNIECLGSGAVTVERNLDSEAITKVGNKLFLTSEALSRIKSYPLDMPVDNTKQEEFSFGNVFANNYGLESLTYDEERKLIWTASEATPKKWGSYATSENGVKNIVPFYAFNDELQPVGYLNYQMDAPMSTKPAQLYAMGVSELCAMENDCLLVLERELFVPKKKIGAFVHNKLYSVETSNMNNDAGSLEMMKNTGCVSKKLVYEWQTKLNLTTRSFANYEGMCKGPRLKDGSVVLILVADSQNQYAGVLKDWFKTIVVRKTL